MPEITGADLRLRAADLILGPGEGPQRFRQAGSGGFDGFVRVHQVPEFF
jgi:hypothetical protein